MKITPALVRACLALFLVFVFSPSVGAAELAGLSVGDKAPGFELKNQDGETVKLRDLTKKGPVALVFYRSADW